MSHECITHHHACDCREAEHLFQIEKRDRKLETAKQRELKLLAVIEKQRDMLAEADLWLEYLNPESLPDEKKRRAFDEFLCDIEPIILCDPDTSQALREHEAKMLAPESKRLDFVLDNVCFIQSKKTDSGTWSYQLMSQNEDEEFFTLHNPDDFFKSPRDAIDASIRMAEERRKK